MNNDTFWAIERAFNGYRRNAVNQINKTYPEPGDRDMAIRILEWRLPGEFNTLYRHARELRDRLRELSPDDPLLDKPRTIERVRTPTMQEALEAWKNNNDSWILAEEPNDNVGRSGVSS